MCSVFVCACTCEGINVYICVYACVQMFICVVCAVVVSGVPGI